MADDKPKKVIPKNLEDALKIIEQAHGKGSIMKLGDRPQVDIDAIDSGSFNINEASGIGGYPKGRIIEIYGPESSGKTTLALHAIAECQKKGGTCAFIDAEHALDVVYAAAIGVDVDNLYLSQPDNGEMALEIMDTLVASDGVDLVVVDSVAALVPKAEIEGNMGDAQMALQARLMSQALRKLTGSIGRTNTCAIFINQLRMKIGVIWGNPETTTGGNALKFYTSMRIDIRRIETIKQGDEVLGTITKVEFKKNKLAPPFRKAIIEIRFGKGISRAAEIIVAAVKLGVIDKAGSWYSYKEERIGQGLETAKAKFKEDADFSKEIEDKVLAILSKGQAAEVIADVATQKTIEVKKEEPKPETKPAESKKK